MTTAALPDFATSESLTRAFRGCGVQAGADIPPVIWRNNLERTFLAVDDLECRERLG
jgi:hypothetical protein